LTLQFKKERLYHTITFYNLLIYNYILTPNVFKLMKSTYNSDSVLVSSYIDGNEKSIEILIVRHKQRVFSFILSKVLDREVAEDIYQDTFIKVIRTLKRRKYNEEGKFLPWVMRISHNLVIDHFRRNKRIPTFKNTDEFDIFTVIGDEVLNIENKMIKSQIFEDIKNLIYELPTDQKEVLLMRMYKDWLGEPNSELAHALLHTNYKPRKY